MRAGDAASGRAEADDHSPTTRIRWHLLAWSRRRSGDRSRILEITNLVGGVVQQLLHLLAAGLAVLIRTDQHFPSAIRFLSARTTTGR